MAEISVERKGSSKWLWIIVGLIVLALLFWFIFGWDRDTVEVEGALRSAGQSVATAVYSLAANAS